MELDVLLKIGTQLVTVQVVAEGEALPRDQQVYLTPHRHRKEGFQAVCQEQKCRESTAAQPRATPGPSLRTLAAAQDADGEARKSGPEERASGWGDADQGSTPANVRI